MRAKAGRGSNTGGRSRRWSATEEAGMSAGSAPRVTGLLGDAFRRTKKRAKRADKIQRGSFYRTF